MGLRRHPMARAYIAYNVVRHRRRARSGRRAQLSPAIPSCKCLWPACRAAGRFSVEYMNDGAHIRTHALKVVRLRETHR
jgi:hypothetical protein